MEKGKDAEVALSYKEEGNQFFRAKQYLRAKDKFNYAVINCPYVTNDNLYAVCLSNRSAALFYLKEYELCLNDIEEVLSNHPGVSKTIVQKLYERRGKAYMKLGDRDEAISAFDEARKICDKKLEEKNITELIEKYKNIQKKEATTKPTEDFYISPLVEYKYNDDKGVHMVAKQDIEPGELLLVDVPLVRVTMEKNKIFCISCFAIANVWFPCPTCTSEIFCSMKCLRKTKSQPLQCTLFMHMFGFRARATIRIIEKYYNDDIDSLEDLVKLDRSEIVNKLPLPLDCVTMEHIMALSSVGKYENPHLPKFCQDLKTYYSDLSLEYILHLYKIVKLNGFSSHEDYTFSFYESFINHACWPNMASHSSPSPISQKKKNFYSLGFIKKGAELNIPYLERGLLSTPPNLRRQVLSSTWHFNCQCLACVKDFTFIDDVETRMVFKCTKCNGGFFPKRNVYVCNECNLVLSESAYERKKLASRRQYPNFDEFRDFTFQFEEVELWKKYFKRIFNSVKDVYQPSYGYAEILNKYAYHPK